MKKSLDTLVSDIYSLFSGGRSPELDEGVVEEFGMRMGKMLARRLKESRETPDRLARLRMSNLGTPCERKLWYSVNSPQLAEPIAPHTRIKFLYGDIVEELILFLVQVAGHKLEGYQDEIEIGGVRGHRDGVVDGITVDVKSANSRGFGKFKYHELEREDPFGYLLQLGSYVAGDGKNRGTHQEGTGAFIAFDKELGHIVVDKYNFPSRDYYEALVERKKKMVDGPIPPRGYDDEPDGKSGNRQLCMECRYCPYKNECWPGLRKFLYSNGPKWLTKVVRTPDVKEITGE